MTTLKYLLPLTLLATLASCSSDSKPDDPDDPCLGISTCTTAGVSCASDDLVSCTADANGCLIATTTDCTATGALCDDSSGTATCELSCDAPACAGLSDGDGFCSGSIPVTCTADSAGCLQPADGTSCGSEVCDDSAAAPTCVANGSGDSCAALFVVQNDTTVTGTDFTADFTNVESFDGTSCAVGIDTGLSPEAVFAVDLLAGETVHLSEQGGLDAILGILPTCDGATECLAAEDAFGAEAAGISYTATANETVFAYVSAFDDFSGEPPFTVDYDIQFTITTCGDGITEGAEQCDDNAIDGDGCTSCRVDLGFECDNTSVSVCTGPTDLGTYAAAETIPDTTETIALAADEVHFYRITFTDDVLISGTLDAAGGEDIDIGFFDLQENLLFSSESVGGEVWTDELLPAGTYTILLLAFEAVPAGWTLTMSTIAGPVCGDGIVGVGEACDDNMTPNDGCTACTVDLGFVCDNSSPSVCVDACGNGEVDLGEECDDGNAVGTDRCANTCLLTADVVDAAGNDTFATAQALGDGEIVVGSLDPSGTDPFDLYTFTVAAPTWVTAEAYTTVDADPTNYDGEGQDSTMDCDADPDVHLFDSLGDPTDNGTSLASDDADGDFFCGYVGPNTDGGSVQLAAGTYYIKVNEFFDSNAIPQYALDLRLDPVLGLNDVCDPALDLCDRATLSCDPNTNTCVAPPVDRANYEIFLGNQFDLSNTSVRFVPSGDSFNIDATPAAAYADLPGSGTVTTAALTLTDDGSAAVNFGFAFPYFGADETSLSVNANGNLTFGGADGAFTESATSHFAVPRISLYFDDLNPATAGTVTVDEFANRLTVTFDAVAGGTGSVSAQVQLFSSGTIVMTYLVVSEGDGLVGISAGDNSANPPAETDFSSQLPAIPGAGDLVINEIMANPNFVADTNCDLEFSSTRDEFLEIVNVSGTALDLSGVTITDLFTTRHTFGPLVLADREAVVVYGGGVSSCPGVIGVASSTGLLALNNGGDELTLANASAEVIDFAVYVSSTVGVSRTLDADLVGNFVEHDEAVGAVGNHSAGSRVSGLPF